MAFLLFWFTLFSVLLSSSHFVLNQPIIIPNTTVSSDGTGDFLSVAGAISAAPNVSDSQFIIHVKTGVYTESVYIGQEKTNIFLIGDGIGKTVITSNKSNATGYGMMYTATLDVNGFGFVAKYISFINSAGREGGQALALRTYGHHMAFQSCSFESYQDTIFTAFGTQFFYDCSIYGTIDFIFGNSAVVYQNSNIYARLPIVGESNVITAQGRESPTNQTAIVLHNCTIEAAQELEPNKTLVKTYLGRPWKEYSRTIIMQCYLGDVIDRSGWTEWNNSTFALTTLYYAEYDNRGPGSAADGRVQWPGHVMVDNSSQILEFTVENFIGGTKWLPQTGIPFVPGLIGV